MKKISLYLIISLMLIVLAGSIVRATGAGMGCPDWPKCFGYYVPPSSDANFLWKKNHEYKKGQMIAFDNKFMIAPKDFKSSEQINQANWNQYQKHSYTIYNPTHTWTEYANRMVSLVSGLILVLLFVKALFVWRDRKTTLLLCAILVLMMFQAWLGAVVVFSILQPLKITLHLVFAYVLIYFAVKLHCLLWQKKPVYTFCRAEWKIYLSICALFVVQVALGTQVRQFVDETTGVEMIVDPSDIWQDTPWVFYIHRSVSLLFFILIWYMYKGLQSGYLKKLLLYIIAICVVQILLGLWMYYIEFSPWTQPMHLLFSFVLFIFLVLPFESRVVDRR